jgi:uncharacterized protein (DUF885 family)
MKIRISLLVVIASICVLQACNTQSAENIKQTKQSFTTQEIAAESKKVNDFFERSFKAMLDRSPEFSTYLGIKKNYGEWNDYSDDKAKKEFEITKAELDSLRKNYNYQALDPQTQVSYRMFEYNAQEKTDNFKYRFHNLPVNQMSGSHSEVPAFLINFHQISDTTDARDYISRLQKIDALMDQILVGLRQREEKGIIPPKFAFPMVLDDCKNILTGQPFDKSNSKSTLLDDFSTKINALKIDATTKQTLIKEASEALLISVKPAYDKLVAYFTQLEKKATPEYGAWKLPDGNAFYNQALKNTTTTDLTADQIHEIGLKEVARIQDEMRQIMKKVNFKSDSLQEFFTFMRTDKRFYYPTTQAGKKAYLSKATEIINTMRGKLDSLFLTKPKAVIEVKAVEAFREKSAGGAFYSAPALDGSRPGHYYVNLYTLGDQPIYQMESLAYHEGIPGIICRLPFLRNLKTSRSLEN